MKNLERHIAELSQLLKAKGYDGYFYSSGGHPGLLAESLNSFCDSFQKGQEYGFNFPPSLTTYSYWIGENKESVECHFILDHHEKDGFSIKRLELESRDHYGFKDKQMAIEVLSAADIPSCQQTIAWALEPEFKKQHKKSKGLKI